MKLRSSALLSLAAITLAALASCAASTQLTSSWADPASAGRSFKKIVVVGVSPNAATRRMFEDLFVSDLRARGVEAVQSYTFAPEGHLDRAAAAAKMQEIGADGVIVTRMIDQETVQTYYPPTYSVPSAYYGGWYGYYATGYDYMTSPGYVAEDKVYRLETNFYDLQNDKLAWSGLTETTLTSGSAPESEIRPFIGTLLADMEKHKVLPKAKK